MTITRQLLSTAPLRNEHDAWMALLPQAQVYAAKELYDRSCRHCARAWQDHAKRTGACK